jgi:hypothetical protein
MSSFAHARRKLLRGRRLIAVVAFAAVGSIRLLYEVLTLLFCGAPPCEGGIRASITRPACAAAVGAFNVSLMLLAAGTVLPAIFAVVRRFRGRARRRARLAQVGQPAPEARSPAAPGRPVATAFRVRVPSRLRRGLAWLGFLVTGGASWLLHKVFWMSAANTIETEQVLAAAALPFAWWLLEESRFRPRTLAAVVPAFVLGHWNVYLTFLAVTGWRIVGFAP